LSLHIGACYSVLAESGASTISRGLLGAASALWIAIFTVLWRARRSSDRDNTAVSLASGAYIGGVATSSAVYDGGLESTAAVSGLACVVHAVTLYRRSRAHTNSR